VRKRETWIAKEETLKLIVFVGRFSCVRETSKHLGEWKFMRAFHLVSWETKGRFRLRSLWAWCLYLVTFCNHFVRSLDSGLKRAALFSRLGHIGPNWVNKAWCVCSSLLLLILIACLCLWCCSTLGFRAVWLLLLLEAFYPLIITTFAPHIFVFSFIGVVCFWTEFTTNLKSKVLLITVTGGCIL